MSEKGFGFRLKWLGCACFEMDFGEGTFVNDPYITDNAATELTWEAVEKCDYITVTHAHFDHMDSVAALAHMTGAKTFIGKADLPLLRGEIYHYPLVTFEPDVLLEDGDVISLGNTSIRCVSTPGHTDGTMSFFFDVTDGVKTVRAGMFGGAGCNTLQRDFIEKNNLSFDCRQKYIDSVDKIIGERVDLFMGNHLGNNNTEEKLALLETSEENPFLKNSQDEWTAFLEARRKSALDTMNT
jgi:metallo-beta-lactamase class B